MDAKRTLWYLKKISLLSVLGREDLSRLVQLVEIREMRRRDVIYLPGDPGNSVYFVSGGRIKISIVTRDGKALTLNYCVPTEIFGESSLIDGGPREEMAEVLDNAVITEVPLGYFDQLLAHNASLGYAMTKLLAKRRKFIENKLEALVFRDVVSKLAEFLLELAKDYGVEEERGTLVAHTITHQEIANLIGTTRETVSISLGQFKKKNFICMDGRRMIIADAGSLRALF